MVNDGWNIADVWESHASVVGDAPALFFGDLERSWSEFEDRAARLASTFVSAGLEPGAKVALYLYNGAAYLEATFAAFKQRLVPVNVNYRYTDAELVYLLDNSDAEVVVVDTTFVGNVARIAEQLPKVRLIIEVDEIGEGPNPAGATIDGLVRFEDEIAANDPAPHIERSLDDLWFLYTGGTTGMPKGVMWPHRSLIGSGGPTYKPYGFAVPRSIEEFASLALAVHDGVHAPVRLLPAAPLMHGTSAIASWGVLNAAGSVVLLTSRSFDAAELLSTVQRRSVTNLTIVGDAFAKPMIAELEAAEERGEPYDLSSLRLVVSSGVMWSQQTKDALLARADVACADLLGSSEGVGFANSVAKRNRPAPTARFRLGPDAQVFNDAGERVVPGSGERGVLAVGGPIPIGYYKDTSKSAETFRTFEGRVWSVPGDFATVEADDTITLLGRGSVCINTAGEKVFAEEVEETLKRHADVRDANVVGVPDDRWGNAVVAVVGLEPGVRPTEGTEAELRDHCRTTLAGYKVPKRIVFVDSVLRGPTGKADYRWAASIAAAPVAEDGR